MKVNVKKEKHYGAMALAYIRRNPQPQYPTIRPNTPEWDEWRRYFVDHLGFMPYAMHRIISETTNGEFTVPADTPQQFDSTYGTPTLPRKSAFYLPKRDNR